jgi:hypothetical protein
VDPNTCRPIQPWDFLAVNTIFQVIHSAGLRTAWSDKHAIYTSFTGPGSNGISIDDFFGPEIDAQAVVAERHAVSGRRRMDGGQRRDPAVRRLQGAGGHQLDQRL